MKKLENPYMRNIKEKFCDKFNIFRNELYVLGCNKKQYIEYFHFPKTRAMLLIKNEKKIVVERGYLC